ncbi:class I SAM-dependent methyltransferase [Candidatus Thioglobus sp.]|nr:class I SAM-dependent methyltransferase [Candidatus Thioglobus sp.]
MREFDALSGYPEPKEPRYVHPQLRTIHNRIIASYRDREFYDGDRNNGYGGFKNDGRWAPIAQNMLQGYSLNNQSSILHIGCDKGFLLHEFLQICPDITIRGTEISDYAINYALPSVKPFIQKAPFTELPFVNGEFDFIIAIGAVYSLNLPDSIKCLKEIQRVGKGKSFITLGAYDTEEDLRCFRYWTLLGCTVLSKTDWVEVLNHVGYTGDYKFNTAQSLNLIEKN